MDRNFRIGRRMEGLVNLVYRFAIPQGTLPWQPIKDKIGVFRGPIFIVTLRFQNRLQYRNSDFTKLNGMNFSVFCTILVRFDPVTPEFTLLTTFATIQQKSV